MPIVYRCLSGWPFQAFYIHVLRRIYLILLEISWDDCNTFQDGSGGRPKVSLWLHHVWNAQWRFLSLYVPWSPNTNNPALQPNSRFQGCRAARFQGSRVPGLQDSVPVFKADKKRSTTPQTQRLKPIVAAVIMREWSSHHIHNCFPQNP